MPFRKKCEQDRADRRLLVDDHFGVSAYDSVRQNCRGKKVGADDVLDAFAALWTAERIARGEAQTLPVTAEHDRLGLRLEIVY